jgi:hypothetical protein
MASALPSTNGVGKLDHLLDRYIETGKRMLWVGPPGCAKTGRVETSAARTKRRLVVSRASLSDRCDYGGCLVPDHPAEVTRQLPLELIRDMQTTKVPTIFFLDDLGQAPMDVQGAVMRLFDPGFLSPSVIIWGATNRPGDKAGVSALCEPLRSRFDYAYAIPTPTVEDKPEGATLWGTWQDELAGWVNWAYDHGAPPQVPAFHRFTAGQYLYQWEPCADPAIRMPDYRTWDTVIRSINDGLDDTMTLSAAIGKPAAAAFLSFCSLTGNIPSPEQVWMDPANAPVPEDPGALYLVSSTLAVAATEKHAKPLLTYIDRMPRVYGALCARDAQRRLERKLTDRREWVDWFTKNQALFTS